MATYLVTGAAGFLGGQRMEPSALAHSLPGVHW